MHWKTGKIPAAAIVAAALMALVAIIAVIQYGWVGELTEREGERMRMNLRTSVAHLAFDVDQDVVTAYRVFGGPLPVDPSARPAELLDRVTRWKNSARHPELVTEIFHLDALGAAFRLDGAQFVPSAFPFPSTVWLSPFDQHEHWTAIPFDRDHALHMLRDGTGFVVAANDPARAGPRYVVLFDTAAVTHSVIPALIDEHLGTLPDRPYDVVIEAKSDDHRVIFSTAPEFTLSILAGADVVFPLFRLPLFPLSEMRDNPAERHERPGNDPRMDPGGREHPPFGDSTHPPGMTGGPPSRAPAGMSESVYEIRVRHKVGSLEAAVQQSRLRHLMLSFGTLVLLVAALVFLFVSAERSRALARRQMEFVASVTHELRTPLAVLRSAGENLADGIVVDHERLRTYGSLIRTEVDRLGTMVENTLSYAGISSDRAFMIRENFDLRELLTSTFLSCRSLLEEERIDLSSELPDGPMTMTGDRAGLQTALRNIITNAVKYSGSSRWIGVHLSGDGESPRAEITIRDRGIGIERAELAHIFEPFYRGASARDRQIRGSGLGLSLAKHIIDSHHGTIDVTSTPGEGSCFRIVLPLAADLKGKG